MAGAKFLERTELMRHTDAPIWGGGSGPVSTGDERRDAQRPRLLEDQSAKGAGA